MFVFFLIMRQNTNEGENNEEECSVFDHCAGNDLITIFYDFAIGQYYMANYFY